jgi:hypothetical protein
LNPTAKLATHSPEPPCMELIRQISHQFWKSLHTAWKSHSALQKPRHLYHKCKSIVLHAIRYTYGQNKPCISPYNKGLG